MKSYHGCPLVKEIVMKRIFTVGCLFTLLSAQTVLATTNTYAYYTGQELENIKAVQILGVLRSPENKEREDQVGKTLESNKNQLRYCYERALLATPLESINATFYFLV